MTLPLHTAKLPMLGWLDDDITTRLMLALALYMLATFVVFVPAWLLDPRMLDGALVWTKPQKFHVSLFVHFVTLAILGQQLPRDVRTGKLMLSVTFAAAISLVVEAVYIAVQAGRARRSHYNFETPIEDIMYALMGLGAVILVVIGAVLAYQIWRYGKETRPGLRWGAILGLGLGFVTSMVFATYMSSTGRYVGAELDTMGATVPFFGWSREFGDLRPAHFVSLHLMQTLPIAGYIADRQGLPGLKVVIGVAVLQTAIAIALFAQALLGQPIWPI